MEEEEIRPGVQPTRKKAVRRSQQKKDSGKKGEKKKERGRERANPDFP